MAEVTGNKKMFVCQFYTKPYTRRTNLNAHLRTVHDNEQRNEVEKNAKRKNNDDGAVAPARGGARGAVAPQC